VAEKEGVMEEEQAAAGDETTEPADPGQPSLSPTGEGGSPAPEDPAQQGSGPEEGARSRMAEDPGRHGSAPEEGALGAAPTTTQPRPPSAAAPNWDRIVIIAQLVAGVALVVFGALLAALTKEATHDIGTAVIGVGAALIPAGAAASATARIAKTNSGS
jgi:hypothetical protein